MAALETTLSPLSTIPRIVEIGEGQDMSKVHGDYYLLVVVGMDADLVVRGRNKGRIVQMVGGWRCFGLWVDSSAAWRARGLHDGFGRIWAYYEQ